MIQVHSMETFGTHEGPGIRLVVFLQGCRLRCLYCHNPDTWAMTGGKPTESKEILEKLENQRPYFGKKGGLTVSGGEPLLQRKELLEVFKDVKKAGYHIALDTNGTILDAHTKELLKYVDLVLLDIKHINPLIHRKLTGTDNAPVLRFADYLTEIKKPFWIRYVLVPGWTDQKEYLHEWAQNVQQYSSLERVEILPYHTYGEYKYEALGFPYQLKGVSPPNKEKIEETKAIIENYFTPVYIR